MRKRRRWSIAVALGLGLTLGRPSSAHADNWGSVLPVFAAVMVAGAADIAFIAYDGFVMGKNELPSRGWSIAEIVVTAPQTLLFNGGFYALGSSEDQASISVMAIPVAAVSALTVHGIWSTASDRIAPTMLPAISCAIGANTVFTGYDITRAANGKLGSRSMGIVQLILTTPQTVVGAYEIAEAKTNRGAWIGLTAWSGALMAHGIASAIWGRRHEDPPPPPPPPPPDAPPAPPGDREKPPLVVPASIHFGPTMVTDGVARAPGLGVSGLF